MFISGFRNSHSRKYKLLWRFISLSKTHTDPTTLHTKRILPEILIWISRKRVQEFENFILFLEKLVFFCSFPFLCVMKFIIVYYDLIKNTLKQINFHLQVIAISNPTLATGTITEVKSMFGLICMTKIMEYGEHHSTKACISLPRLVIYKVLHLFPFHFIILFHSLPISNRAR